MLSDLKFALRQLVKSPGFAAIVILTLALGIGANTVIFSAVDAVLFRPQPYPQPDRLVNVFERVPNGGRNSVSGSSFKNWREHQTQFEALAIYANDQFDLTGRGDPEKISALTASSEFTRVLGIPPLLGRGFLPEDDQLGGQNHVVILTERFWRLRFGAAPSAIGDTLQLDGKPHTIVGVLRDGTWFQHDVQIFTPYVLVPNSYLTSHDVHRARVIGRLAAGVSPAQAETELNAIKENLKATYPPFKQTWGVALQPTREFLAQESKPVVLLLLGAVALVLLIACANVANLLLARGATRQRELAVRAALGASGWQLVRQVLVESLVLSLLGGGLGVLFATWSVDLLGSLGNRLLPATMTPHVDLRVLGFSLAASCATGLLFGILPALRARRPDLTEAMKQGGTGTTDGGRNRSQSTLVIAEVALTAILLVGTGLLVRGMVQTVTADPGINPRNVLMFDLTMPFNATYEGDVRRMGFINRALEEIRSIPGVRAAASTDNLPFSNNGQGYFYSLEEKPDTRQERVGAIKYVSPAYFETLGARIVRGRALTDQDNRAHAPRVLVVNQRLVDTLFGTENPLGRRLHVNNQAWEIVGVAADMRVDGLPTPPRPTFYAAQWHFPWASSFMVSTQGDPLAAITAVTAAIHRLDPTLPLVNPRSLESAMRQSLGPQKLILNLIAAFAATALLLASLGLYGVMSYTVVSRRRELSIRAALGANAAELMRLVVRRGLRLTALGLAVGLLCALAFADVLASRLPGVTSHDPLVTAIAAVVLVTVGFIATWLPARRAARADPIVALRAE